jgi:phosphosulfolactate phosphohydrolase-like enzyme
MVVKVKEIKKLEDDRIAVRWSGSKIFYPLDDSRIAEYLIYLLTRDPEEVVSNINSIAR